MVIELVRSRCDRRCTSSATVLMRHSKSERLRMFAQEAVLFVRAVSPNYDSCAGFCLFYLYRTEGTCALSRPRGPDASPGPLTTCATQG
ncbi:hypothetical protein EVAR_19808_1 [Eumeta japonica]|uniref:Uncharacterized protein n=1 Tax=Eumeta variegata TaxID=151549 RepID=A0A4C1US09_EUMVA|nr:hypothetical protein EVAR_19808_1 [Eumeta japonica]